MVQPLPAFQKRWMPVATIVSPSSVTRSVGADLVWWTARTGWKPSAPVDVFWDSTRSPTWIDSIGRGPSMVRTSVPAAKHSSEADQLGESTISVNVGLVVVRLRLEGVAELVGPPALPLLGLGAQVLAGERLQDGEHAVVELVDLGVDRLDGLDVRGEPLLEGLVLLADRVESASDLEVAGGAGGGERLGHEVGRSRSKPGFVCGLTGGGGHLRTSPSRRD